MKYLIFYIALILFTVHPKQKEYICIRHIGTTDKPIGTFIISKENIMKYSIMEKVIIKDSTEVKYAHNYIVDSVMYEKIKTVLINFKKNKQKRTGDFGQFQIYINGTKSYNYVLGAKKSTELFNLVREKLKNGKNIIDLDNAFDKNISSVKE